MPRAGGVYSAPPGTTASPNTTIESAKYNALVADLVADANAARPVTAGGSGATSAIGANDAFNTTGADIASAATVNLANATGVMVNITGTVTITSFGTVAAGVERELVFTGSLTLTHNATSLILPTGANIQTAAGDVARMRSLGGGNWKCVSYQRANGAPLAVAASMTIATPTLTLKQSAAPTPTAEGDVQWDTDDNVLLIGDGVAAQTFVPFPASVAAGDLFYAASSKALVRLPKGTAGQKLVMNGGATAPQWTDDISLGIGQTWQDVSGSRTVNTSYQNTTGKPITIVFTCDALGGGRSFQVSTDNSTWVQVVSIPENSADFVTITAVIPASHYYRISGTVTLVGWSELR